MSLPHTIVCSKKIGNATDPTKQNGSSHPLFNSDFMMLIMAPPTNNTGSERIQILDKTVYVHLYIVEKNKHIPTPNYE